MSNGQQVERTQQLGLAYVKPMISTGSTTDPKEQAVLGESDGKLIVSEYGKDSGGTSRPIRTDSVGRQEIVNTGADSGGTNRTFKTETDGAQIIQLQGKDSGGTQDPVRTNDNQQLFTELYEKWIFATPFEFLSSDQIVWDPGTSSSDTYLVEMELYNFSGTPSTITLYIDVAAGGTPGNNEYIMNAESLSSKSRINFTRVIRGNDDLRGLTSVGNDVNIHFNIRQVARV